MTQLIDAYDSYKDFDRYAYFTVCFDALPSCLGLDVPLKETKENMDKVLEVMDFDTLEINPKFKNWTAEDVKNSDSSKDYAYQYLMKSEKKSLILWISLDGNELSIEFLYDLKDSELEAWVIHTHRHMRTKFGELKTSTFRVLSRNERNFYTEAVSTGNFDEVDVSALYNDDFQEINAIISNSIGEKTSGLILLHGEPGTGKTSYIKHLISRFDDKHFIFVQNEFVVELLKPSFISFLLKNRDSILIIEDAEKVIMSREYMNQGSVVSTILQLTDGLFSDYLNIKIICTFNTEMEKVDKALLRKGRMIANYEFKPLAKEKTTKLLNSLGFEAEGKEMTLADIFRLKQKSFQQHNGRKKIGFV